MAGVSEAWSSTSLRRSGSSGSSWWRVLLALALCVGCLLAGELASYAAVPCETLGTPPTATVTPTDPGSTTAPTCDPATTEPTTPATVTETVTEPAPTTAICPTDSPCMVEVTDAQFDGVAVGLVVLVFCSCMALVYSFRNGGG